MTPSATDAVAGDVPIECVPPSGSVFPLGSTTVTCTASDAPTVARQFGRGRGIAQVDPDVGNVTTGSFTVTVEAPPVTEPPIPPTRPITTDPSAPASTDSPATTHPPTPSRTTVAPGAGGSSSTIATSGDAGAQLPATGNSSGALVAVAGALLLCRMCRARAIAAVRWRRT